MSEIQTCFKRLPSQSSNMCHLPMDLFPCYLLKLYLDQHSGNSKDIHRFKVIITSVSFRQTFIVLKRSWPFEPAAALCLRNETQIVPLCSEIGIRDLDECVWGCAVGVGHSGQKEKRLRNAHMCVTTIHFPLF